MTKLGQQNFEQCIIDTEGIKGKKLCLKAWEPFHYIKSRDLTFEVGRKTKETVPVLKTV